MHSNDQPITKKDLIDVINQNIMPAMDKIVDDIKLDINDLKNDLGNGISKTKNEMTAIKDEILTSNDKLISEIKKDREEFMATVINSKHAAEKFSSHDKTLANHESRLKTLESQPA